MKSSRLIYFGLFVFLALIMAAILAPWLAPFDPALQDLAGGLSTPSFEHWLGQDKLGRDLLSRIIYGARVSLIVGVSVVGIGASVGITIGLISGYFGGVVDEIIMRIIDVLMAFPGILLAIALTAVLGPSLANVIFALSVLGWVGYTRLVRGEVLSLREREFVLAEHALGAGAWRIMLHHLLPNLLAPVIVQATFGMAIAILSEAALSFLGLGTQGIPSWGGMITEGVEFLRVAPHLALFPGLAIMIVVLGLNILGDGLRDLLDPKKA
jgi:peptide/nickel transport system permease protein